MRKILITGGNGYVAKALYKALKDKYDITVITRSDFDLSDSVETSNWFNAALEWKYFDVVLHTACAGGSRLKDDNIATLDNNLKMYYNLLSHQLNYRKLIHFGSGAEIYSKDKPYGLSKHVIRESILEKFNFYNLRIYAVFDENELDTRFIKANIKRYINREPMVIHRNRYMDFFYMKDLISLVEYYIENDNLIKEYECSYFIDKTLFDIAAIINTMEDYYVDVTINNLNNGEDYVSKGRHEIYIPYKGLEYGIRETYDRIKFQLI